MSDHWTHHEPGVRDRIAEAEQRGREDNADHGMCYVHGSRALDALIRQKQAAAWDEGCRAAHQALGGQFIWFAPENPYLADPEEKP